MEFTLYFLKLAPCIVRPAPPSARAGTMMAAIRTKFEVALERSRIRHHSCVFADCSLAAAGRHARAPAIHSDGYTSFERRWGRNYERAICEFGKTLLYLPPQHKKLPKADLRMQKCIWPGKVSETGETTSQRNQAYKRYEQYGDYNRTSNTTSHC